MMKIYDEKGQPEKAIEVVRVLIDKEVKVPSSVISRIKAEAKNRIESE